MFFPHDSLFVGSACWYVKKLGNSFFNNYNLYTIILLLKLYHVF